MIVLRFFQELLRRLWMALDAAVYVLRHGTYRTVRTQDSAPLLEPAELAFDELVDEHWARVTYHFEKGREQVFYEGPNTTLARKAFARAKLSPSVVRAELEVDGVVRGRYPT